MDEWQLWEYLPTITLDRDFPRFSDDEITTAGPSDPRGIEMETWNDVEWMHYRSSLEVKKGLRKGIMKG
jgi:hypothetical protein